MQVLDALAATYDPFPLRAERAAELSARYPFAAQLLDFYGRLIEVQARAFAAARTAQVAPSDVAAFAAEHVLPDVIDATTAAGPKRLVETVVERFASADMESVIRRWLAEIPSPSRGGPGGGLPLTPVEAFLARAAAQPVLEAIGQFPSPLVNFPPPLVEGHGGSHCPRCGGLPQLSYFALSGEALVSGPRYLVCARCSHNWVFSRMTCAACGEHETHRLPIYQEGDHLPHMRVDACESCHQYLLTIDLRKDTRAIPIVDELAGLPLDLYAQERGMTKITPNLLGN
jgi:formate dehydrogenase maturation protein FdhE